MPPQKLKVTNEPLHPMYVPNESNGQHKIQSHASLSENHVSGCACPLSAKQELPWWFNFYGKFNSSCWTGKDRIGLLKMSIDKKGVPEK